jgi:hypothetical protein
MPFLLRDLPTSYLAGGVRRTHQLLQHTTVSGKSNVPAQGWLQGWEQGGKYMYNTSKLPFSMSTLRRDHVLTALRVSVRVSVRGIVYVFAPLLPPL